MTDLDWVWWSCLKCKRTVRTIHWWAKLGGCLHGDLWKERYVKPISNESVHGKFSDWLKEQGLALPRKRSRPTPVLAEAEEVNPWI